MKLIEITCLVIWISFPRIAASSNKAIELDAHQSGHRIEKPWPIIEGVPASNDHYDGNLQLLAGDTLIRTCYAPYPIKWLHPNNTAYMDYSDPVLDGRLSIDDAKLSENGRYETTLSLRNLQYTDTGFYVCAASAEHDQTKYTAGFQAENPPSRTSRVYVFVKDNQPNHIFLHWKDQERKIFDIHTNQATYLSCLTTNMDSRVTLTASNVKQIKYDHRFGFLISPTKFEDISATCRAEVPSVASTDELNFLIAPVVEKQSNMEVHIGSSAEYPFLGGDLALTCSYQSEDMASVECSWSKDNGILNENFRIKISRKNPSMTLRIQNLKQQDSGNYTCTCHRTGNPHQRNATSIRIDVSPTQGRIFELIPTTDAINVTALLGDKVNFSVSYMVWPSNGITPQWFHRYRSALYPDTVKESELSAHDPICKCPISSTDQRCRCSETFVWNRVRANHTGDYVFRLTALDKIQDLTFRLNVITAPKVAIFITASKYSTDIVNPEFLVLREIYHVHCFGEGYPVPQVKLEWAGSPDCATKANFYTNQCQWISLEKSDPNGDQMDYRKGDFDIDHVSVTQAHKSVTYRCSIVGSSDNQAVRTPYVVVDVPNAQQNQAFYADVFVGHDRSGMNSQSIHEGDRVVARCRTHPSAHMYSMPEWIHNSGNITGQHTIHFDNSSPYLNILELIIDPITANDSGIFTCKATSLSRNVLVSNSVTIDVLKAQEPNFGPLTSQDHLEANFSKPVEIRCDPIGGPRPTITWLKNGRQFSDRNHLFEDGKLLKFTRVMKEDEGEYACKLENSVGKGVRNFTLSVLGGDSRSGHILPPWAITVLGTIMGLLAILVVVLVAFIAKSKIQGYLERKQIEKQFRELRHAALAPDIPVNQQPENLPYNEAYEIPLEKIVVTTTELGKGETGKVLFGKVREQNRLTPVALKVPRVTTNADHITSTLNELKMLIYVSGHMNVLGLLGAVTKYLSCGKLFVVTEFCERGSLDKYLMARRSSFENEIVKQSMPDLPNGYEAPANVTKTTKTLFKRQTCASWAQHVIRNYMTSSFLCTSHLLSYAYQVANGMNYLASKKLIHRDLAARNILINDDQIAKICDFGLSRHNENYRVQHQEIKLPIKWIALESLIDWQFTVKSDVWSFGVLMWEIFSLARDPYPNVHSNDDMVDYLKRGHRLPIQLNAPKEIWHLTEQCWDAEPYLRPSFSECMEKLYEAMGQCCPAIRDRITDAMRNHDTSSNSSGQTSLTESNSQLEDQDSPALLLIPQGPDVVENLLYFSPPRGTGQVRLPVTPAPRAKKPRKA